MMDRGINPYFQIARAKPIATWKAILILILVVLVLVAVVFVVGMVIQDAAIQGAKSINWSGPLDLR